MTVILFMLVNYTPHIKRHQTFGFNFTTRLVLHWIFFRVCSLHHYLVPKVIQVFLDSKDFQDLRVLQFLVFQAQWGYLDLREMKDFLVHQETQDDQALQARSLLMKFLFTHSNTRHGLIQK